MPPPSRFLVAQLAWIEDKVSHLSDLVKRKVPTGDRTAWIKQQFEVFAKTFESDLKLGRKDAQAVSTPCYHCGPLF
jgi:hypothetical protein